MTVYPYSCQCCPSTDNNNNNNRISIAPYGRNFRGAGGRLLAPTIQFADDMRLIYLINYYYYYYSRLLRILTENY